MEKGFRHLSVLENGWLLKDEEIYPVTRVDIHDGLPEHFMTLYVDAIEGRIRESTRLMRTDHPEVLGLVYLENPTTTPDIETVTLDDLYSDAEHLYGSYAHVETCVDRQDCKTTEPLAISDLENGFIYTPAFDPLVLFDDPFAEVNAYRNITNINSWIRHSFGWDSLFDGETWIHVKVGRDWDNAGYYAGSSRTPPHIVFGVAEQNYAYDADTAHHEFGHAINDGLWTHGWMTLDSFGTDTSMFAIEEALADIWAFSYSGDPVANAYILASRNADNNTSCPRSLLGEGHYDARILTGFAWDLSEEIGLDAVSHIFFRTAAFLEKRETFHSLVEKLMVSVESLASEETTGVSQWHVDVIQETARSRGLLDEACANRLVPFYESEHRYAIGYGRNRTHKLNYPFGFQWEIRIPYDGAIARLRLEWIYPEFDVDGNPVSPGYRVYLRKGKPVSMTELTDPVAGEDCVSVVSDLHIEKSPSQVSYPLPSDGPLSKGDKLYVLLYADTDEPFIALKADLRFGSVSSSLSSYAYGAEMEEPSAQSGGCGAVPIAGSPSSMACLFDALLPFK